MRIFYTRVAQNQRAVCIQSLHAAVDGYRITQFTQRFLVIPDEY